MKIKHILFFATVLAMANVASAHSTEPDSASVEKIGRFVWDGPIFLKDKSIKAIHSLGPIKRESVTKQPNRYIEGKDVTFLSLSFSGLEVYGFVRENDVLGPISVIVQGKQWPIAQGLHVGAPLSRVKKVLGPPHELSQTAAKYYGETDSVTFYFRAGHVAKIEFEYYAE